MSTPLVSVIIPAYNAARYVRRAVDSVLAQTYLHREVIVVDDGSTDGTENQLAAYGEQIGVVRQPNQGLSAARNSGIDTAAGAYLAYLDADDYWLPEKLGRQVALMQQEPRLAFCSTATRVEDPAGRPLNVWRCPELVDNPLESIFTRNATVAGSGSSVMVRRSMQVRAGPFDTSLTSLEDVDMWMRLAALGDYACIEEPLAVIIKRPESMSCNLDVMREAAIKVMRKNRHLLPPRRRGTFWQAAYARVLCDYAKWEYRAGRRGKAALHLIEALARAPIAEGRTSAGLVLAVLRQEKL